MERSSGVTENVFGRDREAPKHHDRQMIQVEEYPSKPENPEESQCSRTGCA